MKPARKLDLAAGFYLSAKHLKSQSLKKQHPDWSDQEIESKVREMFLYASS